jgi:hypothetical protein
MEPLFRLSYSEHEVAGRLQSLLRDPKDVFSVTVPVSRTNKGWDLLIHSSSTGRAARIQIKASRCYLEPRRQERGYSHVFWFKNFRAKLRFADFFVLFGVHASLDRLTRRGHGYPKHWVQKTMILSRSEVDAFLPTEAEKFFYVGFDEDQSEDLIILSGRKERLATVSYKDVRSTVRALALRDYLTSGIEPRSSVRSLKGAEAA